MLMSTVNQAYVFLSTVYGGIIIGFIYDLYRMIRRIIRPKRFMTGALDMLFWLTTSLVTFIVLYFANGGEVRLYTFLGFILGFTIYMLALSPFVMGLFYWLYGLTKKVLNFLMRIIMVPIRFLWRIIMIPANAAARWLRAGNEQEEEESSRM